MKITKQQWFTFVGIVILSFVFILAINLVNHVNTRSCQDPLNDPISVKTADDASYLRPVKNYLESGEWKNNSDGIQSYYTRTPGYSLFCFPYYALFSERNAISLIVFTQCFWIALMAGLMYLMMLKWGINNLAATTLSLALGIIPSFSGYVFYTLTEGLTPVLIFMLLVLYVKKKHSIVSLLATALVFGYLFLTRPVFASFGLLLLPVIFSYKTTFYKRITLGVASAILAFGPMTMWEIRNHRLGKTFEGVENLHSIYSPSNNSVWRAPHQAIYGLVKQFEISSQAYHTWTHVIENKARLDQTISSKDLAIFDEQSIKLFGEDSLLNCVEIYRQTISEAPVFAEKNTYSDKEMQLVNQFLNFKTTYQNEYPLTAYVKTPSKVLKSILWQSHLNLYQYWHTYKRTWWIKPLSYFTSLLHLTIYLFPLLILLWKPKLIKQHWPLIAAVGSYLAYLIFVQRGLEQRYTYPLLPVFYACTVWGIAFLFKSRNSSDVSSSNE